MLETLTSEVVTLLRGNMESDIVIWLFLAFFNTSASKSETSSAHSLPGKYN